MREAIRLAGANGGWLLALGLALVAIVVSTYAYNVVQKAENSIVEPVAKSLNIVAGRCPNGWKDVSAEDEHALVKSCERDGWLVVLDQQGRFDHGFQLDTPGAEFKF